MSGASGDEVECYFGVAHHNRILEWSHAYLGRCVDMSTGADDCFHRGTVIIHSSSMERCHTILAFCANISASGD